MTGSQFVRRAERPRLVMWFGPGSQLSSDLRDALPRLPLAAVFVDTESSEFERALVSGDRIDQRLPVPISDREAAGTWEPRRHLPLFRIAGSRPLARSIMIGELGRLVEEKPLYVGVGLGLAQAAELVEALEESDPRAPLFLIESVENLRAPAEVFSQETSLDVTAYDGWSEFQSSLATLGVSLSLEEEPRVLVRSQRVPLNEIFADPELRIDDRVRLITTRALFDYDQAEDLEALLDSLMRPDEARSAATIEEDLNEWWAIGHGLAFRRGQLDDAVDVVLARLERLEGEVLPPRAPVCWLPCQSASGATTFLHCVAREVASRGYPTLVVKQLARNVDWYQIATFLKELNRLAGLGVPPNERRERPALLVLDAQHCGTQAAMLEELADRIMGHDRRQVLTLWAQQVGPYDETPPTGEDRVAWYRAAFDGLIHRQPIPQDEFLPMLRSGISEAELGELETHILHLRRERGLGVYERTRETWTSFQQSNAFRRVSSLPGMAEDERPALEGWLRAEELFWPALYHFLRRPGGDREPAVPTSALGVAWPGASAEMSVREALRLGIALEVAKASAWGVTVPTSALVDWARATRVALLAESDRPKEEVRDDQNADATDVEQRLRAWAKDMRRSRRQEWDPVVEVRRLRDELEDDGTLRSILLGGHSWVRTAHRVIARVLLLQAARDRSDGLLPRTLGEHLGSVSSLWQRDDAFSSFQFLLSTLSFSPQNLALCEQLSEALLLGSPSDPGWWAGVGEGRLALYEGIPGVLVESSRALLHHRALVRMRSARYEGLSEPERESRLVKAKQDVEKALTLPWQTGVRDEHPGHLHTSLGLIWRALGQLGGPDARTHLREARRHLSEALVELPDSRHTRLALGELLLDEAAKLSHIDAIDDQAEAVGMAGEVLRLLSVAPTGEERRWTDAKSDAIDLFSDDAGWALVESLKERGEEVGYLYEAEMRLEQSGTRAAIAVLQPLVSGDSALAYLQATRRLAELLQMDPVGEWEFKERFRLLSVVDAANIRLSAEEQFHLACLEYSLGRYDDGRRRFAVLRDTKRAFGVPRGLVVFLRSAERRRVVKFVGRVRSMEGGFGWLEVCDEATGEELFTARFVRRHFTDRAIRERDVFAVVVRFGGPGPNAVPPRFAQSEGLEVG